MSASQSLSQFSPLFEQMNRHEQAFESNLCENNLKLIELMRNKLWRDDLIGNEVTVSRNLLHFNISLTSTCEFSATRKENIKASSCSTN